jgi:hypothetical protein
MSVRLSDADVVWNRACLDGGGSNPRKADRELTALLQFDSLAGNGGLGHVFNVPDAHEIEAALQGFRYFGLDHIASFLEGIATLPELQQENLSKDYWALTKNGEVISTAFEEYYLLRNSDFAPP